MKANTDSAHVLRNVFGHAAWRLPHSLSMPQVVPLPHNPVIFLLNLRQPVGAATTVLPPRCQPADRSAHANNYWPISATYCQWFP
jgi:hypothetical protein